MEKYLDFRFRNFVVISQQEIVDYYNDVYVPRFKARSAGTDRADARPVEGGDRENADGGEDRV
jgi:hypothetical protein